MLWYSTPWTATTFSNDPLWLNLFVEGVNDHLLDHCQVSSVPHFCGFKEQDIPTIYTIWMVIYWNSNVNILIFWDTHFWLSLAVSSNHQKTFEVFYFTCNESKIYESFTFWNKLQGKMFHHILFFFLDVPVYLFFIIYWSESFSFILWKEVSWGPLMGPGPLVENHCLKTTLLQGSLYCIKQCISKGRAGTYLTSSRQQVQLYIGIWQPIVIHWFESLRGKEKKMCDLWKTTTFRHPVKSTAQSTMSAW